MPKVILGAGLESIQGKVQGTVFRHTRSGTIITPTVHPAQRKTAAEAFIRGNLNRVTGSWHALSDLQKAAWNKYASMLKGHLNGYNAYVRNNTRLLNADNASLTMKNTPPFTPNTPDHVTGLDPNQQNGSVTITWDTPDANWQWVQLQYSIQAGFSPTGKERWTLLPAIISSDLTTAHAISLPEGFLISYRARTIDNSGRVSPWTESTATGAVIPPAPPGDWLQLKEHRNAHGSGQNITVTFDAGGGTISTDSSTSSRGWAHFFFNVDRLWLEGKKLRIYWEHPSGSSYVTSYVQIRDGEYIRSSEVDFPDNQDRPSKGNGLLSTMFEHTGNFGATTQTSGVLDLSGGSETKVTVFVSEGMADDADGYQTMFDLRLYSLKILSAGDDTLIEFDLDPRTMEVDDTYGDYGYTEGGP